MREVCGNGRNGSDQPDNGENVKDRLAPRRLLHDLEPQLGHFLADIGKLGFGLGSQIGELSPRLGPQIGELGLRLGLQTGQLRVGG